MHKLSGVQFAGKQIKDGKLVPECEDKGDEHKNLLSLDRSARIPASTTLQANEISPNQNSIINLHLIRIKINLFRISKI